MENRITINEMIELDRELIAENYSIAQRAEHAALRLSKKFGYSGPYFENPIRAFVGEFYEKLYGSRSQTGGKSLTGCVKLRDQAYLTNVPIIYGTVKFDPLDYVEIERSVLEYAFKYEPDRAYNLIYSICDLFDFQFGFEDIPPTKSSSILFNKARSSIEIASISLAAQVREDIVVQNAILTAEFAMKGYLLEKGYMQVDLKNKFGHAIGKLSREASAHFQKIDKSRFLTACDQLPNLVITRYENHSLTRERILNLAVTAQFICAEVMREISDQTMGPDFEERSEMPARTF